MRLGFKAAPESLREVLARLLPEGGRAGRTLLAGGVERISLVGPGGMPGRISNALVNLDKWPMARLLYYDFPLPFFPRRA